MKGKLLLLLSITGLLCTSCLSIGLHMIGAYDKEATVSHYTNGDKDVAYIPMKHIGPKEFYRNVKRKVDSLQAEGYIVYMESVRVTDSLTPQQKDTLKWKIRKLTGINITSSGYIDTINGTLMGYKFKNRKGLVNQPKYYALGVDTIKGRIVDVPMNHLVRVYENEYGPIILNDCDYASPFDTKYNCGKINSNESNAMILDYRNSYLAGTISDERSKKIAVLYGALHESGMYKELKMRDSAWVRKPRQ
ncbi:hypothetical protein OGH69_14345 [Flavobacterium sp. MFBS3-15]|uniref:hypothetical protein n=1 Tax=Flavobacterium sp. MFBS3-15 TaxID=2989816 RepID=UPI002235ECC2|nr:hypothetical protein [Flavobacterium sp. MFBS3-15]MCW4470154.1 hypothetical protein [Flavobacterium sp. MFBS3-15]